MQFTVVCIVKNNAALSHSSLARILLLRLCYIRTYTARMCCVIEIIYYVRIVCKRACAHGGIKNHLVIA